MNGRTNSTSTSDVGVIDIPLDPPTSFICEARNSKVDITWVDPKDKYATPEGEQMEDTDQLVSVWSYTKIVRKEGSQPSSPSDGITVYTSDIRNQHQSIIYEDTGVTNGVTYYYAAYAYNTDGVYSDGAFSGGIAPIEWSTVLNENSWEQIDSACTQGVAQSLWEVGDEINLTVNSENQTVVILGFNADWLSDSAGGRAVITFGSKHLLAGIYNWNPHTFRGMEETYQSLYESIDANIKSIIRQVRIFATDYIDWSRSSLGRIDGYLFAYTSKRISEYSPNIIGDSNDINLYNKLSIYPYYTTQENRVKRLNNGSGNAYDYGLYDSQNVSGTNYNVYINADGERDVSNTSSYDTHMGASFAFCVGKSAV